MKCGAELLVMMHVDSIVELVLDMSACFVCNARDREGSLL